MEKINSISLVIATLNRGEDILSILNQIAVLESKPTEIIVIDQSEDYPILIKTSLEEIIHDKNLNIKYHKIKIKSASYARNYGVSIATCDFIIFIDDDVIIPNDFFEKYLASINLDYDAIAGKVLGLDEETNYSLPKQFIDKNVGFLFRPMNYGISMNNSDLGTCNMLIKKAVFQKLNGFDENLQRLEDSDLATRFLKNRFKSYYDPSISLIHKFTTTGAARNITRNVKPYQSRAYWEQYFYFTIKNFGIYKGKTFILYYLKSNFLIKGYLIRPKRLFFALRELYYGYKIANQKLINN